MFCLLKQAGAVEQLEQKILDVSFNLILNTYEHVVNIFITLVFDMHIYTSWNVHVESLNDLHVPIVYMYQYDLLLLCSQGKWSTCNICACATCNIHDWYGILTSFVARGSDSQHGEPELLQLTLSTNGDPADSREPGYPIWHSGRHDKDSSKGPWKCKSHNPS